MSIRHNGGPDMYTEFARDLRTVIISVVASSVLVAVPAVLVLTADTDKVDGRHAVGASTNPVRRAGKLIAASGHGYLPNDIISKALNADQLDGMDSSAFLGSSDRARDSARLDGVSSSGFWRKSERVSAATAVRAQNAGTLAGRHLRQIRSRYAANSRMPRSVVALTNDHAAHMSVTIEAPASGAVLVASKAWRPCK